MASDTPTLHHCLSARPGPLRELFHRAERLAEANRALKLLILEPWVDDVRLVNVRGDTAILFVSNASALVPLRFCQPALLRTLREHLKLSCSKIEVKVRPVARQGMNAS